MPPTTSDFPGNDQILTELNDLHAVFANPGNVSPHLYSCLNEAASWLQFTDFKSLETKYGRVTFYPLGVTDSGRVGGSVFLNVMFEVLTHGHLLSAFEPESKKREKVDFLGEYYCSPPYFSSVIPLFPWLARPQRVTLLQGAANETAMEAAGLAYWRSIGTKLLADAWYSAQKRSADMTPEIKLLHDGIFTHFDSEMVAEIASINSEIETQKFPIPLRINGMAPFFSFSITSTDPIKRVLLLHVERIGFCTRLETIHEGRLIFGSSLGIRGSGDVSITEDGADARLIYEIRIGSDSTAFRPEWSEKLNRILSSKVGNLLSLLLPKKIDLLLQ